MKTKTSNSTEKTSNSTEVATVKEVPPHTCEELQPMPFKKRITLTCWQCRTLILTRGIIADRGTIATIIRGNTSRKILMERLNKKCWK
jgi:hypothetical protein